MQQGVNFAILRLNWKGVMHRDLSVGEGNQSIENCRRVKLYFVLKKNQFKLNS